MAPVSSSLAALLTLSLLGTSPATAQTGVPELDQLHDRVRVVRAQLPELTALAEKYARFLGQEASGRFLISPVLDPAFYREFLTRAGGPPDTRDTDEPAILGLVLLSVRHWTGTAIGIAAKAEQFQSQGRPVLMIGPAHGRPDALLHGVSFVDDGAPDGDRANASINGIANMIVAWTFYSEVVAAATRAGWQPGILLSVLMPGATANNSRATFRMPGPTPVPIPGGTLGTRYLAAVDSILTLAAAPAHRALMDSVAATLRLLRRSGKTLYASSCGHYLIEEIPRDAIASATFSVLPSGHRPPSPGMPTPSRGDAMVWFGYGGFDCPNMTVADSFRHLGLSVVVVSDQPPQPQPANLLAEIPLPWQLPDGVVTLPFSPGRVAPLSSVDMATHYVWFRRLIGTP